MGKGEVKSPRIFGRPRWSWASALTTRWGDVRLRGGAPHVPLRWWCRLARRILWPLCRTLTGHRQAAGERGYGGNGMIDVFCAYCYCPWQVPASEMPSADHLVHLFHNIEPPR